MTYQNSLCELHLGLKSPLTVSSCARHLTTAIEAPCRGAGCCVSEPALTSTKSGKSRGDVYAPPSRSYWTAPSHVPITPKCLPSCYSNLWSNINVQLLSLLPICVGALCGFLEAVESLAAMTTELSTVQEDPHTHVTATSRGF